MNLDVAEKTSRLRVKPRFHWWYFALFALIIVLVAIGVAATTWYQLSLRPVGSQSNMIVYKLPDGQTARQVSQSLRDDSLIRSSLAFRVYMHLHGGAVKAGVYRLNQDMSVSQIAGVLTSGKESDYNITFYPGATVRPILSTPQNQRMDAETILLRTGFSDQEIASALDATYTSPLFAGRPASAGLEGYVFGDTYQVAGDATAGQVLQQTFNDFWQQISSRNLVSQLQKRGFNLFQGITLASIVQAEASTASDQRQVAQVFELRLKDKMPLGSDVTFIYAANLLGVKPTPTLNSPYNTRIYAGLPPGPVDNPGITALEAVADPAAGDYLYFVAGDNGTLHFAKTIAEHEANIKKYCATLCG